MSGRRSLLRHLALAAIGASMIGALGLGGCATPKKDEEPGPPVIAKVSGVAMYLQRVGLPAGSRVTAQLIDASAPEVVKPVIGVQVMTDVAQLPVRFQIEFDLKKINPESTYLVQVTVDDGKRPLLVNRGLYPVLTRGYPSEVEVLLDEPVQ